LEYFLDTSVIVAYASSFGDGFIEKYGKDCETFLENEFDKITSNNVEKELNSVKRRRIKLYRKIIHALSENTDIHELEVDDNIRNHFEALVELIKRGKIGSIDSFRRIEQIFGSRVRKAKTSLIKEIVNVTMEFERAHPGMSHNKLSWESLLGNLIGNTDDGRVIMDCVVLSAVRGKLTLATLDNKHMLSKKDDIKGFVEEYCSVVPSFNPDFDLRHVRDILNSQST